MPNGNYLKREATKQAMANAFIRLTIEGGKFPTWTAVGKALGKPQPHVSKEVTADPEWAERTIREATEALDQLKSRVMERIVERALKKNGTDRALFELAQALWPERFDGRVRAAKEINKGQMANTLLQQRFTHADVERIRKADPVFQELPGDATRRALNNPKEITTDVVCAGGKEEA